MKRDITQKLNQWKDSPRRKPLLVRGARQVGKTYSILDFGKTQFSGSVHTLNFEKNPELHIIFERNLDSNRITSELELFLNKRITPTEDLVFFDEIQECPKAIMALRYFYEEKPELHLIAAGSLLEFALKDISFPVGRLQTLFMHPMTFSEFLHATDKELLANQLIPTHLPHPSHIIQLLNTEMYNYFVVGGMPESVKTYIETGSYIETIHVQTDLILTYRQDFSKYAGHSDKRCLNSVLTSVANRVGEQIKYSKLDDNYTNPTLRKAFELLETARLFTKVKAASPAGVPLGASASEKKFKTVFLDIGLLSNLNGFYADRSINKEKFTSAFNGKMAEQFIGQELRAATNNDLYYWSRDARGSSAETDYLIEKEGQVIPIEVKSGKTGSLKSLHLLLDTFTNIQHSYVFTEDKFGELPDHNILFLPLYLIRSIIE